LSGSAISVCTATGRAADFVAARGPPFTSLRRLIGISATSDAFGQFAFRLQIVAHRAPHDAQEDVVDGRVFHCGAYALQVGERQTDGFDDAMRRNLGVEPRRRSASEPRQLRGGIDVVAALNHLRDEFADLDPGDAPRPSSPTATTGPRCGARVFAIALAIQLRCRRFMVGVDHFGGRAAARTATPSASP
jgi:hypothetical protein